MFTGIIEGIGTITNITDNHVTVRHPFGKSFPTGASISLSGMCATILKSDTESFLVEIIGESRDKTIFGEARVGQKLNLERSAKIGDRNSGHFVSGHIDTVGHVLSRKKDRDYERFRIGFPKEFRPYIISKGSIAVDGISLTIADLSKRNKKESWFEVAIIRHTLEETTLGETVPENGVNLEFDLLGKYALNAQEKNLDKSFH